MGASLSPFPLEPVWSGALSPGLGTAFLAAMCRWCLPGGLPSRARSQEAHQGFVPVPELRMATASAKRGARGPLASLLPTCFHAPFSTPVDHFHPEESSLRRLPGALLFALPSMASDQNPAVRNGPWSSSTHLLIPQGGHGPPRPLSWPSPCVIIYVTVYLVALTEARSFSRPVGGCATCTAVSTWSLWPGLLREGDFYLQQGPWHPSGHWLWSLQAEGAWHPSWLPVDPPV